MYSFIAWTKNEGRAKDIAANLNGEAYCVYPFVSRSKLSTIARYKASALLTIGYLVKKQPRAVIVTNPPVFPALIVWAWCRLTGRPFALDSHPTSFGAKDHRVSQRLLPVHRWLARRAAAVLVTAPEWVEEVDSWGGTGVIVHEPPIDWAKHDARTDGSVLYVGTFAADEPTDALVDAAASVSAPVYITGDVQKRPPDLAERAGPNVHFTGYLNGSAFHDKMNAASVVVVLTTEPTSVMRAAYEAVWCQKSLVLTDTPLLRENFPHAFFASNQPGALVEAVELALQDADTGSQRWVEARRLQMNRWDRQRNQLIRLLAP